MNCNRPCSQCAFSAYCDYPDGITRAEMNIPSDPEDSFVGEGYIEARNRRPNDWRLRLPELEKIKLENAMINRDITFQDVPTLDSFAAFSGFGDTSISPAAGTSNSFIDAISGVITNITPAAAQRVSNVISPQTYVAPRAAASQALTAAASPSSSKLIPILAIGGAAVLIIILMASKKG